MASQASPPPRPLFVIIAITLPFAILAMLELGLRLVGFGRDIPLFIDSETFEGYAEPNPGIIHRYFPDAERAPDIAPDTVHFRRQLPADTVRIVVQGGSTAAGFPYGRWGSLQGMLDQRFRRLFPEQPIEVINTAMSSVNTYTLLDFVDEIVELEPDMVLIYAGHNEYVGIMGVGSSLAAKGGRALTLAYLRLKDLKLYQLMEWVYHALLPAPEPKEESRRTLMARVAAEKNIALGGDLYRRGVEQFDENLGLILEAYREAGIPVLISTLASNEEDQPPFSSIAAVDWQEFRRALERGEAGTEIPVLTAVAKDSGLAGDHYKLAMALRRASRNEEALEHYQLARDLDALRFRAPAVFNELIRSRADEHGALLVDAEALIRSESRAGIIGSGHMLEHLHPNARGYFLLAEAFVDRIVEAGLIGVEPVPVPRERAWREIPLTETARALADYKIARLKADYPFTREPGRPSALPSGSFVREQAARRAEGGSWMEVQQDLLAYYQREQDLGNAALVASLLSAALPGKSQPRHVAAQLYRGHGDTDMALYYHRSAVALNPGESRYRLSMAQTYFMRGELARSLAVLDAVLRTEPGHPDASRYRALVQARLAEGN